MTWTRVLLSLLGLTVVACNGQNVNQGTLDYMSEFLQVRYDVRANKGVETDVRLTLKNIGNQRVEGGNWAIYFCSVRILEPNHYPYPEGLPLGTSGLTVFHINGCLFRLQPNEQFKGIPPYYTSLVIDFIAGIWTVSRSDLMPKWYVTEHGQSQGLQPKILLSTSSEDLTFVGDFDTASKWKRNPNDRYNPYTAHDRYNMYDIADLGPSQTPRVIPQPLHMSIDETSRKIDLSSGDWVVTYENGLQNEANMLVDALPGTSLATNIPTKRYIHLSFGHVMIQNQFSTNPESYDLNIDPDTEVVSITGTNTSGVFYGVQTLLSLSYGGRPISRSTFQDTPRYSWRGFQLDVSRNFFSKAEIMSLLDTMATYKLNKFHFHLTDDEGWRLEIPGLPELTTLGAQRCHDPAEDMCVQPQLGSGPLPKDGGTGFYSVADYREILAYAEARHIEVIPEIDVPGHAHAPIKAMEKRYRTYMAQGNELEAWRYRLIDPEDNSVYLSVQYFTDNAINPCQQSTYNFMGKVVQEIKKMHEGVQPLKIFHFGGDEVASGAWLLSPACVEFVANNPDISSIEQMKKYFVSRVSNITAHNGLDLGSWEDGILDSDDNPQDRSTLYNERVYSMAWDNIWEWGKSERAYILANAGFKAVMSQATHLYFDHPQEPDPEERGYYWAPRFTDTSKTFGFMPDHLYDNIATTRFGDPLTKEDLCGADGSQCVKLEKPENIVGMQGQIWTETVRTAKQLHGMLYPRILALAERAWHRAAWEGVQDPAERAKQQKEDWTRFANALGYTELAKFDAKDIHYQLPVPGGNIVATRKLVGRTAYPGLKVLYSDGSGWKELPKEGVVIPAGTTINLATRSTDTRRLSRAVKLYVQ